MKLDNFGVAGTRHIMEQMGLATPPPSFVERAVAVIGEGVTDSAEALARSTPPGPEKNASQLAYVAHVRSRANATP